MRKNIMSQMKQITMVHVKVKEIYQIVIKQMVLIIGVFDAREFGRNEYQSDFDKGQSVMARWLGQWIFETTKPGGCSSSEYPLTVVKGASELDLVAMVDSSSVYIPHLPMEIIEPGCMVSRK